MKSLTGGVAAVLLIVSTASAASLPEGGAGADGLRLRAFPAQVLTASSDQARDCLAQAIYYEAGGEPRAGREAVAQVVLNRLHSGAFPKSVCSVVYEGATRRTGCQFTFTCDGSLARAPDAAGWRDAEAIAAIGLAGQLVSTVGVSTHYHTLSVHPAWDGSMTPTLRIGNHQFYRAGGSGLRARPDPVGDGAVVAARAPQASAFSVWGLQVAMVRPVAGGGVSVADR